MAIKTSSPTPVISHPHADSRANIPTEELFDFIADEERNPQTVLYPRDPQLARMGKNVDGAAPVFQE